MNAFNFTTNNLFGLTDMFNTYEGTTIPFTIDVGYAFNGIQKIFQNCQNLITLPTINFHNMGMSANGQLNYMFEHCESLITVPDGYFSTYDFTGNHNSTGVMAQNMFNYCKKLTHIDSGLLPNLYSSRNSANAWQNLFCNCESLPEILNLGIFHPTATVTNNMFRATFGNCYSLSRLTFAANGATRNYSHQGIDLSTYVGFSPAGSVADSVYNHASAVETINSLPDCSAVSPPSNPTNMIQFKAGAGANTAGGSISDLTAAEIEVATNKGWQVVIQ